MSDPSQLENMPFSTWLSVPEGPPRDVWESALSALGTGAVAAGDESAADDSPPQAEESLPDDVVVAWNEDPEGDPVLDSGSDRPDAADDDVGASIPTWERPDGDDWS